MRKGAALVTYALLGAFGFAASGQEIKPNSALPRFDIVSVKPSAPDERPGPIAYGQIPPQHGGYWSAVALRLSALIAYAFDESTTRVEGIPAAIGGARYDIQARMPPETDAGQFRLMLQALLADRFQLKAHMEMRPTEVSVLKATDHPGPGLHPASGKCVSPTQPTPVTTGQKPCGVVRIEHISSSGTGMNTVPNGIEIGGDSVSMAELADFFSRMAVHPVIDETGLHGVFDIDITLPAPAPVAGESQEDQTLDAEQAAKSVFRKQLGLELDLTKTVKHPMPYIVIEHLEGASGN